MILRLMVMFFVSGALALVYETVFGKLLSYVFGVTAYATSTVLASFMAGMALGGYALGRVADRVKRPIVGYAVLELCIGLYCLAVPTMIGWIDAAYAAGYQRFTLSLPALTSLRFALSFVMILIPTFLMGGTLPMMARFAVRHEDQIGRRVSWLYAMNTLGAAMGTVVCAYLLMPNLPVDRIIRFAAVGNALVFGWALLEHARANAHAIGVTKDSHSSDTARTGEAVSGGTVLLVGAGLSGVITLGYEVVWTHVLAQLIGTSVYAFGIMLFSFLVGLGLGAAYVTRVVASDAASRRYLVTSQLIAAGLVAVTMPLWPLAPEVFRGMGRLMERGTVPRTFGVMEATRFATSFALMIGPTFFLGCAFPLLVRLFGTRVRALGGSVGRIYFVNTLGAIIGSVGVGFLLLPTLKSQTPVRILATLNVLAAALYWWKVAGVKHAGSVNDAGANDAGVNDAGVNDAGVNDAGVNDAGANDAGANDAGVNDAGARILSRTRPHGNPFPREDATQKRIPAAEGARWESRTSRSNSRARWHLPAMLVVTAIIWLVPGWNLLQMNRGSNVLFTDNNAAAGGTLIFHAEDLHGGVTAVTQWENERCLWTNGKFEGNNTWEKVAQQHFAHYPCLYAKHFERLLTIGLGTGCTLGALTAYPFERIDVCELSPNIVRAARECFTDVNFGCLDRDERITVHEMDGRNYLRLHETRFDVISVQVSSIWFAGAANLYNREFYELCRQRLEPDGVLQQWVQLHHQTRHDLAVTLRTARQVFKHALLFTSGQGVILLSNEPLVADYASIARQSKRPGMDQMLSGFEAKTLFAILGTQVMDEAAIDSFLADNDGADAIVSSDLYPYLEYATPRNNALSAEDMARFSEQLRSYIPTARPTVTGVREPDVAAFVEAAYYYGRSRSPFFESERDRNIEQARSALSRIDGGSLATVIQRMRTALNHGP